MMILRTLFLVIVFGFVMKIDQHMFKEAFRIILCSKDMGKQVWFKSWRCCCVMMKNFVGLILGQIHTNVMLCHL